MAAPRLVTFDILGTVVDWRRGLLEATAQVGCQLAPGAFDAVIDRQAALERGPLFRSYSEITALSLAEILGLPLATGVAIGAAVGRWPPFPDAPGALQRLLALTPCVAMTNSDRAHAEEVQRSLGVRLTAWLTAQDVRCYKPDPRFWAEAARRLSIAPGPDWWHVSAYADYDLAPATALGLTTVLVERPHSRPGPAAHAVPDLAALAALVERRSALAPGDAPG